MTITLNRNTFIALLVAVLVVGYLLGDQLSYSSKASLDSHLQTMTEKYREISETVKGQQASLAREHAEIDRTLANNERVLQQIEARGY